MDQNEIATAAKGRFDKSDYVYQTQDKAGETPDVGKGIGVETGRKNGQTQTGIGIDCSNLVHQSMLEAGYNVGYVNTGALKNGGGGGYYDKIDTSQIKSGDIVLFNGHMGVVTSYDASNKTGTFYGSQSSTGPQEVKFTTDSSHVKGADDVQYWGLKNGKPVIGAYRVKETVYDPEAAQQQLAPINEQLDRARQELKATPEHHSSLEDFDALVATATESGLALESYAETATVEETGETIYAAFEVSDDVLANWADIQESENLDVVNLIEASGIDLDDDLRAEIETVTVEAETSPPSYPTVDTSSYAAWTQSRAAEIGAYRNDPAALALYGSAMAAGAIHGALVNPTTSNVLLAFNATVKASIDVDIALDKTFLQNTARQLGIEDDPGSTAYGPEDQPANTPELKTAGEKLADYVSTGAAALIEASGITLDDHPRHAATF